MDVFTHFLLPYFAALVAFGLHRVRRAGLAPDEEAAWERRAAVALIFGLAGFAPDLDGALTWTKTYPGLYWMQHRGVSHAIIGAPVFALIATALMAFGAMLFPKRFALFRFRPVFVPAAIMGSFTHLFLDSLTYGGAPLLWPFAWGRPTFDFYHWIVDWLFPIGLIATLLHIFGVVDRRGMAKAGAMVVLALIFLAGIQLAERPDPNEPGAMVFTRHELGEWTVVYPDGDGWVARIWNGEQYRGYMRWDETITPGSEEAVRQARDTDAYKGFRMGSFGPIVVQTHSEEGGRWSVSFLDVAQRFEASMNPKWTPTAKPGKEESKAEWGHLEFVVTGAGDVRVVSYGW